MQKYHDEPKQYKGYLKSALAGALTARPLARGESGRNAHGRRSVNAALYS